jgi:hypothetical protein
MSMAQEPAGERRRDRRYTFINEVSGERLTPVPAGPLKIEISNISRSGLMLHTNFGFFLSPGYQVRLTFANGHKGVETNVLVKVVWMRHHGLLNSVGRWALGVKYEPDQDDKAERLCKLAEGQWNGSDD